METKRLIAQCCEKQGLTLLAMETDSDHIHVFVSAPPRFSPALMEQVSKPAGTIFMHDLPALREEDVTSEVLDGPQSIAFHQAHNKMYGAMAVLEWCILGPGTEQ